MDAEDCPAGALVRLPAKFAVSVTHRLDAAVTAAHGSLEFFGAAVSHRRRFGVVAEHSGGVDPLHCAHTGMMGNQPSRFSSRRWAG